MPDAKFNIFTGVLKALDAGEFGDGIPRLKTTASSTIVDLAGDRMTQKALDQMAKTAERGMTIFLNHSYRVPEDVLGTVEKAEVVLRDDYVDLDFQIKVAQANPRAVRTHEQIEKDGVQLGCSIGAMIPSGGAKKTDTGLEIDDVHLLEASIVGIPANPRAFAHYAAKALYEAEQSMDEDDEEEPQSAVKAAQRGVANGLPIGVTPNAHTQNTLTVVTSSDTPATVQITPEVKSAPEEKTSEQLAPERNENEPNDGPVATSPSTLEERTAPSDEEDKGDTAGTQPAEDVPATQEAPTSDPENDGDEDDSAEAIASKSIGILRDLLRSRDGELVEARKALSLETEARVAAENRADEAEDNLRVARDIVESLAALPMGRRTHFAGKISDFRSKLSGVYAEDVLKLVEKHNAD